MNDRRAVLVALVFSLSSAASATKARVLGDDAEFFIREVESKLEDASLEANRAEWVQKTYVTDDTSEIAARANRRRDELAADDARRSRRFDLSRLTPTLARKITLLRRFPALFPPLDPKSAALLSRLIVDMEGEYGKGAYCPKASGAACLGIEGVTRVLATSRDPKELLAAWNGWAAVGRQMRPQFSQYVALANAGARDAGLADAGVPWRSTYDVPPEKIVLEVDRLWEEIRPLYVALHAYVRMRLRASYKSAPIAEKGLIPAHLLGNLWGQDWANLFPLVAPKDLDPGFDLTRTLSRRGVNGIEIVRSAERFFTSLGFPPLAKSFWERSMFERPVGREVICHASAHSIDGADDSRIKACLEPTAEMFQVAHHELGHVFYFNSYRSQSFLFKEGASDAFHEAVGDAIALSLTPGYLKKVGLLDEVPGPSKDIGLLLRQALSKVAFLPFGLLVDQWRWKVFSGAIRPENYNRSWWELKRKYQGVSPPTPRSEADFDPGAKYHVAANVPYLRYFMADLLQFQFHRALSRAAGCTEPLHRCSIYQSAEAGAKLRAMLALGASRPWTEALHQMTGEDRIDGAALREYFAPLEAWLEEQLRGEARGWE